MKSINKREYLDYYNKHKIIPVVNINDLKLEKLFNQRKMFYYKLGLNPFFFQNKNIIEYGPGNGLNAYYLLKKCKIKSIKLVDNNPTSIENLKKNLKNFKNIRIENADMIKLKIEKKYDVVICENVLPGLKNPKNFFLKLLKSCKSNGVIIITLTDYVGIFSEKLRFVMAKKILDQYHNPSFNFSVKILSIFFKSHLKNLSKNTRKVDKWVQDNIMHEAWITKKNYFNLNNLHSILKKNSAFISKISPELVNDFQWYKNSNVKMHNQNLLVNYNQNKINLLHINEKFNLENSHKNKNIILNIVKVIKIINKLKLNKKKNNYQLIDKLLLDIMRQIDKKSKLFKSLNEFIKFNPKYDNLKYFKNFWGHCTNQVAIFKCSE